MPPSAGLCHNPLLTVWDTPVQLNSKKKRRKSYLLYVKKLPVKNRYPMIETQSHTVLKVMMWEKKYTSLYESNLHSIFKNLTCTNQNSVTHALKDKLFTQRTGWKLMQLGGKHVRQNFIKPTHHINLPGWYKNDQKDDLRPEFLPRNKTVLS